MTFITSAWKIGPVRVVMARFEVALGRATEGAGPTAPRRAWRLRVAASLVGIVRDARERDSLVELRPGVYARSLEIRDDEPLGPSRR